MTKHRVVGSTIVYRESDHQRRVEPTAELIATFDVNVGRPTQIVTRFERRDRRRSTVEPNVEDVRLFCELSRATLFALEIIGKQFARFALVPGVCRLFFEDV